MNPMTNDLEQLRGDVERLVYSSEESGFTICRLLVPGRGDLVTVAGNMPGIQPGERLLLRGRWINHPVHGYQFRAESYSSQLPASANAVRRYLVSSLVKGIGPVLAGRLVDCFGDETLRVIDEQPERLAEAPGVGPRRVESIKRAWEEQQEIRNVMLFLQGHGVSAAYASRIYKTYGQDAVKVVQGEPLPAGPGRAGNRLHHRRQDRPADGDRRALAPPGPGRPRAPAAGAGRRGARLYPRCRAGPDVSTALRPPRGAADGCGGRFAEGGTDRAGR